MFGTVATPLLEIRVDHDAGHRIRSLDLQRAPSPVYDPLVSRRQQSFPEGFSAEPDGFQLGSLTETSVLGTVLSSERAANEQNMAFSAQSLRRSDRVTPVPQENTP